MRQQLIELVDPGRYDCFVDGKFSKEMLGQLIDRLGITDWPRTPTGQLSTERTLFRDMAARYPELEELKELYSTLQSMKEFNLGVGPDGRHRAEMLSPFGTDTMRHNPSKFILALARWFRGLVKPAPGRAVVYSDYGAQEIYIAAWLSQDPNLLAAVRSGDPYLWFAIKVGLAPEGATKATHKALRDWLKPFLLGIHYGLSVIGAAVEVGRLDRRGRPPAGQASAAVPGLLAVEREQGAPGLRDGRDQVTLGLEHARQGRHHLEVAAEPPDPDRRRPHPAVRHHRHDRDRDQRVLPAS